MRLHQTLAFYNEMGKKYDFDKPRKFMTIREAFVALEDYVDASDPDLALPNLVHMLQTAEGIRKQGKPDWFQLVGLLHDMGKVMFLFGDDSVGQGSKEQWSLGGDTFAVGCQLPDVLVHSEFNHLNPDMMDGKQTATKLGIYEPKCGLAALKFAWGHDEYMYRMLVANNAKIPPEGLAMIRYHSAYCWHTGGAYSELTTEEDEETKQHVIEFNEFDLYTKDEENILNVEELWPYYQGLIDKYLGEEQLKW
jgi:inositol oxygenase